MAFVVHRSNALERLADRLAELVVEPLGAPTQPELLAVQSRGMERWVSQQLADRLGIWANARFLFPRNLVELVLHRVLADERDVGEPFSRESLTWAVAALLPGLLPEPAFAPLRGYLEGDTGGVRRLQLARHLGDLLDQYVVYRPELVLGWEAGPEAGPEAGQDDDWQARLWRALASRGVGRHLAARAADCVASLAAPTASLDLAGIPSRVTLFGISTLPPLFLRVLHALSAHRDVHLLQLSPCREYWADLRPADALADACADAGARADANPLLASLGKLGRDFQAVLEDTLDYQEHPGDLYRDPLDPAAPTVLATLQSDLLHQRRRAGDAGAHAPVRIPADDGSLAVHSCHGPMREAEVLRDQLLALFAADPTLEPRHVLVMTPDIDTYAPYLDAALGASEDIPYAIADRSLRRESAVVEAFLAVLDLLGGRFGASAVVDLLAHAAVRERFGLADGAVETVRQWVAESGIRWGVDAEHRAELGQPACGENTWRFGLDRLLLGHAMAADGRTLFAETLPCDPGGDDEREGLGAFADLCETLFALRRDLAAPRTVEQWRRSLVAVLDRMVSPATEPLQHQLVRERLERLADQARGAGFADRVTLDALRDELWGGFAAPGGTAGFLSGGVTVCEMLPMRSIPFRVVALVGMSDDRYPRRQRRLGFDRLAQRPRPGDRNLRDDDRYQLLECLLAARERLIVTFVGQSSRDGSPLPPSVVVSELADAVAGSCTLGDGAPPGDPRAAWERLVVRHPLQPFSPRYFDATDDARLFSYDAAQAAGAARLCRPRRVAARFVTALAPPAPETELALDTLTSFYDNPARALLSRQLGLTLGGEVAPLPDREPFALDGLGRWALGTLLLDEALAERDPRDLFGVVRAAGTLPLGWPGRLSFEEVLPRVEVLRRALEEHLARGALPALRLDIPLERLRLTGWLRGLRTGIHLSYRYGKLRAKDLLAAWIRHLALCAAEPHAEALGRRTVLVGQSASGDAADVRSFAPVAGARARLAALVRLAELGRQLPLRLFPEPSLSFVQAFRRAEPGGPGARDAALGRVRRDFDPATHVHGAEADVWVRQAHAGAADVLDAEPPGFEGQGLAFTDLAVAVFGPLLDALEGAG